MPQMRAWPGTPLPMRGLPATATGIPMMPVEPWPTELLSALVAVSLETQPLMIHQLVHALVICSSDEEASIWICFQMRSVR